MAKLHLELDGSINGGAIALLDGIPQTNITGLRLILSGPDELQEVTIVRAILMEDIYTSAKDFIVTKLTITAEIQEVQ